MPEQSGGLRLTFSQRGLSIALLLSLLLSGCRILGLDDEPQSEPKEGQTAVLFIGSSYTAFNNVPDRFRDLSRKAGERVFVRYHLALGQPLSYFAASPAATDAIRSWDWDYIVLQGGHRMWPTPPAGAPLCTWL